MKEKKDLEKIESVIQKTQDNVCPDKEGDNCRVPGVFNDSDPIGGS